MAVDGDGDAIELGAAQSDLPQELGVLGRERVADRVGQVDRRGAGRDRLAADSSQEDRVGARRVLGRELHLVGPSGRVGDCEADLLDDLVGLEPELALHVQGARCDEDVDARASRARHRLDRRVDVLAARAGKRGDGRTVDDRATSRTPSKSPGEDAGNPASITSTPRRSSCSAISAFSCGCSAMPGDCSPSRKVVSKMVILRRSTSLLQFRSAGTRAHRWCDSVGVCGYKRRVSDISPLAGENDEKGNDRDRDRGGPEGQVLAVAVRVPSSERSVCGSGPALVKSAGQAPAAAAPVRGGAQLIPPTWIALR